jgi:hypothetical protein
MCFDFWCRGDRSYEVYISEPHKGNRLTRQDFHPELEKLPAVNHNPSLPWEKTAEWTYDWIGPFYVAAIGDDRYFVTDTGRLYIAPPPTKPRTPLKQLWSGPPVDVLIHDDDAKTFYAFTKDQWFEIADPIQPKPHNLVIQRAWTANRAIETAAQCGKLIRSTGAPPLTDQTWDDLASADTRTGGRAVWSLAGEPARAVALLALRLKPVQPPPAQELAALIHDLDAASFSTRETAQARLRALGRTIEPLLREAVPKADGERKRRLDQLLAACQDSESRTPDERRAIRAVQALDRIATPGARQLLETCSQGAAAAVLTREASRALELGKAVGKE